MPGPARDPALPRRPVSGLAAAPGRAPPGMRDACRPQRPADARRPGAHRQRGARCTAADPDLRALLPRRMAAGPTTCFEEGLRPSPTTRDAIWQHLGELVRDDMPSADWASLQPAADRPHDHLQRRAVRCIAAPAGRWSATCCCDPGSTAHTTISSSRRSSRTSAPPADLPSALISPSASPARRRHASSSTGAVRRPTALKSTPHCGSSQPGCTAPSAHRRSAVTIPTAHRSGRTTSSRCARPPPRANGHPSTRWSERRADARPYGLVKARL